MQHYQLMAMYKLSDVVLDSVYFGGDTTTREAFEVGSPVVTLPGKTIGQRWTQAYYKVMGILDYVVDTADEYVSVATKFANADGETKRSLANASRPRTTKSSSPTPRHRNYGATRYFAPPPRRRDGTGTIRWERTQKSGAMNFSIRAIRRDYLSPKKNSLHAANWRRNIRHYE